jgi:hypothetical protein
MLTKPLIAVATVAAALGVSAGFPVGQSAAGLGVGVANASPCPPFLPCQGPPKPPRLPGLSGGGGPGPKGPNLPDFGGGPGPKGPKLPDFGGGPGPNGPKLPDFGGGPGPKGPDFGVPGLKGAKLPGPADVRRAFTVGGPPAGVRINVPGALRVPKDFRPDFRLHVPGLGRLNPDPHINFRWPGGPPARLRGDFKVKLPWLVRPLGDFGRNFGWPWHGRVPADLLPGFHWRVSPRDLRVDFGVGRILDFSADWRDLLRLAAPPWHGGIAPWGLGPAPWGWGPPPPPAWAGWIPPAWGPAPAPFDYWGFTVIPVWDPYFQQWGFWEFGVWVPLPGQ